MLRNDGEQYANGQAEGVLLRGRYLARIASTAQDIKAAQRLRGQCFRTGQADRDAFDERCRHVLIEQQETGALMCCFRVLTLPDGSTIEQSYSAQFYDLSRLGGYPAPMIELGRFCIRDGAMDPDILRIAWGAITALVDADGVRMLFGCSSFAGNDVTPYLDSFALLKLRHQAPQSVRPGVKAGQVVSFASLCAGEPDLKAALRSMPPLLRTYLMMGGWVSDHAVVDRDLDTLHVFTGVEIDAIPEGRKRLLRAVAAPA